MYSTIRLLGLIAAMRSAFLVLPPLLAEILSREVDVLIDRRLHLGMAESLLHVAGIPARPDELRGMGVA